MRLVDADEILTKKHLFWIDTPAVFDHDSGYYVAGVYVSDIEDATTINAEPVRHGEWIDNSYLLEGFPIYRFNCSLCNYLTSKIGQMKFCPNCGAKMDGGE